MLLQPLPAQELMARYAPRSSGAAETWQLRYQQAWENNTDRMLTLYEAMREADGWVGPPLLVAWNDTVWDGHHRLLVAWQLDLQAVPYVVLSVGPVALSGRQP